MCFCSLLLLNTVGSCNSRVGHTPWIFFSFSVKIWFHSGRFLEFDVPPVISAVIQDSTFSTYSGVKPLWFHPCIHTGGLTADAERERDRWKLIYGKWEGQERNGWTGGREEVRTSEACSIVVELWLNCLSEKWKVIERGVWDVIPHTHTHTLKILSILKNKGSLLTSRVPR